LPVDLIFAPTLLRARPSKLADNRIFCALQQSIPSRHPNIRQHRDGGKFATGLSNNLVKVQARPNAATPNRVGRGGRVCYACKSTAATYVRSAARDSA